MQLSKRVCSKCMRLHVRAYAGRKGKNLFYRDEHGLLWNGKLCGGCNRIRIREAVTKHRAQKKAKQREEWRDQAHEELKQLGTDYKPAWPEGTEE